MVPLAPGMIISDEPGFYAPGQYGIRLENLLLVQSADLTPQSDRPFLSFETLTLDYRGIGLSKPAQLRGFEMDYRDWARLRDEGV